MGVMLRREVGQVSDLILRDTQHDQVKDLTYSRAIGLLSAVINLLASGAILPERRNEKSLCCGGLRTFCPFR